MNAIRRAELELVMARVRSAAAQLQPPEIGDAIRLCVEVERLQRELADRKVIERAKGIVMQESAGRMTEGQAYHLMRRTAMSTATRLVDVARAILDSGGKVLEQCE